VNLHPDELTSRWLVQPDDPIGFHTRPVYLEVTETAALSHFDVCVRVVQDLRRRTNALLVVDDFGAGYSNLERVVDLEPAYVKLDIALTRGIHENKRKQIVVRHVVALCTELGVKVVAEGVETVDELSCVRDLGASFAQGYLLARPAPVPPVPEWPFGKGGAGDKPAAKRPSIKVPPPSSQRSSQRPQKRATKPPPSRKTKPPRR